MSPEEAARRAAELWESMVKDKKPAVSYDGKRERDGSYANGFKEHIETWEEERDGFTLRAKRIRWEIFNLGTDVSGTRRTFELLKGKEVVFLALCEAESTRRIFGAEERFLGEDKIPAKPWRVSAGELPSRLAAVPA